MGRGSDEWRFSDRHTRCPPAALLKRSKLLNYRNIRNQSKIGANLQKRWSKKSKNVQTTLWHSLKPVRYNSPPIKALSPLVTPTPICSFGWLFTADPSWNGWSVTLSRIQPKPMKTLHEKLMLTICNTSAWQLVFSIYRLDKIRANKDQIGIFRFLFVIFPRKP